MRPQEIVDLDRYPLDDAASRSVVVQQARDDLATDGSAVLPGFLRPQAVAAMVQEAERLLPLGHRRDRLLGAYAQEAQAWMDANHPVRRVSPYRMEAISTHLLPKGGPTLTIYEWDPLTQLVADMLELDALYRVADPMMRCNLSILRDGDEHGWHFDQNDFVVSLLLQKPEHGGVFQFAPGIRTASSENFDDVRAVMDERSDKVRELAVEPGTLALFRGRNALHRVTRVAGARPRIIALFSYNQQPGLTFGPEAHKRVFGQSVLQD